MIRLGHVLKTSWRHFSKTSWRRFEEVLKMSSRRFCKTSWRRLEDVSPRRIYSSWSRRLEDAFWRRMTKVNIFVLSDVFKTSSRCLHQDKCFLGINLVKAKFNSYVFKYSQINNEEVKHLYQILNPKKTRQKHDINLNCQPISEQCSLFIPPKNRRKPKGFWCLQRL